MTDWTDGYVAEIPYTYGYYHDLNPQRVRVALLEAGLDCPEFGAACELGFGQGVSINMHAAASATEWYGTDFIPSHAAFAQNLSAVSGARTRLFDEAFAEFCNRPDLPDFDYIGMHGIWSWISDENRTVLVDFLRRKLKVGGVLYVSYNTLPGHSTIVPMRDLMMRHIGIMGSQAKGISNNIGEAMEFAEKLFAADPIFLRANPHIAERIKRLKDKSRAYLAHEYFNADWYPINFADMTDWLGKAKLTYACSASYIDNVDAGNLTKAQNELLAGIPDRTFRELTRDFITNKQFRKDYWIKGPRRLDPIARAERIRDQKIVLMAPRKEAELKAQGAYGPIAMNEKVADKLLDQMAGNKPKAIGELAAAVKGGDLDVAKIFRASLMFHEQISPVQDEQVWSKVRPQTDRLNAHLMRRARSAGELTVLASPVIGGAVGVNRNELLFLLARSEGLKTPQELAQSAWKILQSQNQNLMKDGKALATAAENIAELNSQATKMMERRLPILMQLQVV